MNIKNCIEVVERAEKAGLEIVVDGVQWDGPTAAFPLDPDISPARCELVAEARRIADMLDRPKNPPDGSAWRFPKETLEAALKRAAGFIEKHTKENGNVQRTKNPAKRDEQPAGARGDHAADGNMEASGQDDAGKTAS